MAEQTTPTPETLSDFDAAMIAEGCWELAGYDPEAEDAEEVFLAANQRLINTGQAWSLQGFFGRQAQRLIDEGHCQTAEDYRAMQAGGPFPIVEEA